MSVPSRQNLDAVAGDFFPCQNVAKTAIIDFCDAEDPQLNFAFFLVMNEKLPTDHKK